MNTWVTTYQSTGSGRKVSICRDCERRLLADNCWPRDRHGEMVNIHHARHYDVCDVHHLDSETAQDVENWPAPERRTPDYVESNFLPPWYHEDS